MAKLPTDLSGRDVRTALERAGFIFRRQTGSHIVLRRDQPYARVIVPDHKQVRSGTLRRIIADANLTVEQFMHCSDDDIAIASGTPHSDPEIAASPLLGGVSTSANRSR